MAKLAKNPKYEVVRDNREKPGHGWTFPPDEHFCHGTIEGTLKTGDYTLVGFEDILSVERKRNTSEWASNVFDKRFDRELQRLNLFKYAFIILEFTMDDLMSFPENSGIPRGMWARLRTTSALLLKKTIEISFKYPNVKIIFAGDKGRFFVSSLFKRVTEQNVPKTN